MNKAKKAFTRAFAVLLVFILLLVGLPVAASAAETTEVKLTLGDLLTYQEGIDWKTHMMYADGEMAYCVNPKLPAPSGTFTTTEKNCIELTAKDKNYNLLVKTLYYGYGGDGFSKKLSSVGKSMKSYMDSLRSTYWLTAKGTSLYYLMTHRVLAYFYGDPDWNYALTGDWKSAILKIVSAIKSESTVPSTTNLYILDTGNSKYQKVILSKNLIKLQLQKVSATPEITDGNNCYSLANARYNIYLDKDCKEYFGCIITDEKGFGTYGEGTNGANVPLQTYFAKEAEASKGYKLDTTVYEFKDSGLKTSDGIPVYKLYDTKTKKYTVSLSTSRTM